MHVPGDTSCRMFYRAIPCVLRDHSLDQKFLADNIMRDHFMWDNVLFPVERTRGQLLSAWLFAGEWM